ncbi:MAG TPA: hypothetical protein VMU39_14485 [Solirubrobacteraceae bacterium]|nr:hypothetical protein [Solirubrobacteraceae bacterium]
MAPVAAPAAVSLNDEVSASRLEHPGQLRRERLPGQDSGGRPRAALADTRSGRRTRWLR